jgi:hypothetical protein
LLGGDGTVRRLITLGSPHAGTHFSRVGIGAPTRELFVGSNLVTRLAAAPAPKHTKITTVLSHADALVPAARQGPVPGAERVVFDDLGHVTLLGSRRVAKLVIDRLATSEL